MNLEQKLTECLREFCNTHSEAAARKVLDEFWVSEDQKKRCDCAGLCEQRGLASDEVDSTCRAVHGGVKE